MPHLGMIMTEGTLAKWHKNAGEAVSLGEPLAEITTEKITYELEAPNIGLFHPVVQEGEVVPVEGLIAFLLAEGEPTPEIPKASAPPVAASPAAPARRAAPTAGPGPAAEGVRAAPSARRLAAQLDIDIAQVPPARPGGRITESDVRAYAEQKGAGPPTPAMPGMPEPSKVAPVQGMRKIIADRMHSSLATTAQLTFHLDVDMTEASALRKEASQKSGVTLSTADFFMKACGQALGRHPKLNSAMVDGSIHYYDQVNIGLAVALDDGLVVPVIKDVNAKEITRLAEERIELVDKAQNGKLLPDDMAGGTFTLTVLGSVDGFTPILNTGQTAILGVGRIAKKPVVEGNEIVVREMGTVSLTIDHRVVDGAPAASFFRRLKQILERPSQLLQSNG